MSENIYKEEKSINYVYMQLRDNGEFYIGIHSDDEHDDNYNGSGSVFKVKYNFDPSRFTKIILFYRDTRKEVSDIEALLVTEESIKNPLCLNQKPGGDNAVPCSIHKGVIDSKGIIHESRKDAAKVWECDPVTIRYWIKYKVGWSNVEGDNISDEDKIKREDEWKKAVSERMKGIKKSDEHRAKMKGKKHALGSKRTDKQKEAQSLRMKGAGNHNADLTIYHFIHKDGATFRGTRYELQDAFPDCKWYKTNLSAMILDKIKTHCGWSLVV